MDSPPQIKLNCAACDKKLSAPAIAKGRTLECPNCSSPVLVQSSNEAELYQTPEELPPVFKSPSLPRTRTRSKAKRQSNLIRNYIIGIVSAFAVTSVALFAFLPSRKVGSPDKARPVPTEVVAEKERHKPKDDLGVEKEAVNATTQLSPSASESPEQPEAALRVPKDNQENEVRLLSGSDITMEDLDRLTGSDWVALSRADRKAVVYGLTLVVVLADQNIDSNGAIPIADYLDSYYSNAGNRNTSIYTATDSYLAHARGIVLQSTGKGNSATDPFYYSGDGYIFFEPLERADSVYSISLYNDVTATIAKANILSHFQGEAEQQYSRLRTAEGTYYLEVNSTIPWKITIVNQRGVEWLKRTINEQKNSKTAN